MEGVLEEGGKWLEVNDLSAYPQFLFSEPHGLLHHTLVLQLGEGTRGVHDLSSSPHRLQP